MHNDDFQVGRLLSRREVVALFGAAAVAAVAHRVSAQTPAAGRGTVGACVVQPQQTEGPYFVDEKLLRSDIRSDPSTGAVKDGSPLELRLSVAQVTAAGACVPLAGAMVDIWQCDAAGVYSDARDNNFNTIGQKFLRGYQVTDASGNVRFTTIYPGWYPGRAVHIHFKIRSTAGAQASEFTSQFYFDEAMSDRVFARAPYSAHTGQRTRNERDGIFGEGGAQLMLPVTAAGSGYATAFNIAMRPGESAPAQGPRGGGRGRGRG